LAKLYGEYNAQYHHCFSMMEQGHTLLTPPLPLRDRRPSAKSLSLSKTNLYDKNEEMENTEIPFYKYQSIDFEQIHVLGSGSGGIVSRVLHKATNTLMARKEFKFTIKPDDNVTSDAGKREMDILRKCSCENIIKLYGCVKEHGQMSMLLEYMDLGSLDRILIHNGPIPEQQVCVISRHVLSALAYLKNQKIIHRDIKPANLLLNSHGIVKVSDFGLSKENQDSSLKSFVGTFLYLSVNYH
jgi:serine/threonine protein kinase